MSCSRPYYSCRGELSPKRMSASNVLEANSRLVRRRVASLLLSSVRQILHHTRDRSNMQSERRRQAALEQRVDTAGICCNDLETCPSALLDSDLLMRAPVGLLRLADRTNPGTCRKPAPLTSISSPSLQIASCASCRLMKPQQLLPSACLTVRVVHA